MALMALMDDLLKKRKMKPKEKCKSARFFPRHFPARFFPVKGWKERFGFFSQKKNKNIGVIYVYMCVCLYMCVSCFVVVCFFLVLIRCQSLLALLVQIQSGMGGDPLMSLQTPVPSCVEA